jgi:tyrosyl-tRNA synthetase
LGGQDQWGNIVAGCDLVRRMLGAESFGATFPLLLKNDGQKFGKTASGAVWLDAERTSPFEYSQFWRNVDDADVGRLLGFFTALPMDEVKRLGTLPAPAINRAKEILAFEATLLAHGIEEATKAYLAAGNEFGFADPEGKIETSSRITEVKTANADSDLPTLALPTGELAEGVWVVKLFVDSGLAKSNGEVRRLIKGGGCYLNDDRITDDTLSVTLDDLQDGQLMIRAGKKNRRRVVAE